MMASKVDNEVAFRKPSDEVIEEFRAGWPDDTKMVKMSKKDHIEKLAGFIGLRAAHEILLQSTNIEESFHHLQQEADNYILLSAKIAKGNWNSEDIRRIKELAKKKCNNKLETYQDISNEKYSEVESIIENIILDLGLI